MGSSLDLNEIQDRTSLPRLMGIKRFLLEYFNLPSIFYFSQFNNASWYSCNEGTSRDWWFMYYVS
jgi:hypothetical protein